MRLNPALIGLLICPFVSGFTFDYEVLSLCEQRHPHDFMARVACNNKVEAERAIRACAAKQENVLESKIEKLHALLDIYSDENIESIARIINESEKYSAKVQRSKQDADRKVLVFDLQTTCNKGYDLTANIYEDKKRSGASLMIIWRRDTKDGKPKDYYRVFDSDWTRGSTDKIKSSYESSIGYVVSADYKRKLTSIENLKLRIIVDNFVKNLGAELSQTAPDKANIIEGLRDRINEKSAIFRAGVMEGSPGSILIDSELLVDNYYSATITELDSGFEFTFRREGKGGEALIYKSFEKRQIQNRENLKITNESKSEQNLYLVFSLLIIGLGLIYYFRDYPRGKNLDRGNGSNAARRLGDLSGSNGERHKSAIGGAQIENSSFSSVRFDEGLEEFKAAYPFVMVYVEPSLRKRFIEECLWLQGKIGEFPPKTEQIRILESIRK